MLEIRWTSWLGVLFVPLTGLFLTRVVFRTRFHITEPVGLWPTAPACGLQHRPVAHGLHTACPWPQYGPWRKAYSIVRGLARGLEHCQ